MTFPANYENLTKLAQALSSSHLPALSAYELGKLIYFANAIQDADNAKAEFQLLKDAVLNLHLLKALPGVPECFTLFGRGNTNAAELICALDPFAYVSHLSAMEHHGLTDRFSKTLYVSRPSITAWKLQAEQRMQKDLGDKFEHYHALKLPLLSYLSFSTLAKTPVHIHERSQLGAFRLVADSSLRVATIGRVFLDMLREPKLCGGIEHVIDIYRENAKRYLNLITDELDSHGKQIDKVRAGFILSEVCGLNNPAIDNWRSHVQRGGSRKLDAEAEYLPHHSPTWMLSINVASLADLYHEGEDEAQHA
jgi:predicted transcriptional regulator of viral defense system